MRVLGAMQIVAGTIFMGLAVWIGVSAIIAQDREPEDLALTLFWLLMTASVGFACFFVGLVLLRRLGADHIDTARMLNGAAAAATVIIALAGFLDRGAVERLLARSGLVFLLFFLVCHFALKRLVSQTSRT